jgi:hypothetical protein
MERQKSLNANPMLLTVVEVVKKREQHQINIELQTKDTNALSLSKYLPVDFRNTTLETSVWWWLERLESVGRFSKRP